MKWSDSLKAPFSWATNMVFKKKRAHPFFPKDEFFPKWSSWRPLLSWAANVAFKQKGHARSSKEKKNRKREKAKLWKSKGKEAKNRIAKTKKIEKSKEMKRNLEAALIPPIKEFLMRRVSNYPSPQLTALKSLDDVGEPDPFSEY